MLLSLKNIIEKPQNAYLILSLIFGIFFIFVTPPFQVPDEVGHFYKSYDVSSFNVFPINNNGIVGNYMPRVVSDFPKKYFVEHLTWKPNNKVRIDEFTQALKEKIDYSDMVFQSHATIAIYSPVAYIPQASGMLIGKILGFGPLILFYLGRIAALLFSIFVTYLSIKKAPFFKWLFVFLAMMPMSLFLYASVSADSITIAISLLFISSLLNILYSKDSKIGFGQIFLLLGLAVCIALSKNTYFILSFLVVLIPNNRFKDKNLSIISKILICLLPILLALLWGTVSSASVVFNRSMSFSEAINYVINNPFKNFLFFSNDLLFYGTIYFEEFFGRLGLLDTQVPFLFVLLPYFLIILLIIFSEKIDIAFKTARNKHHDGLVFLGIFILGFILVTAAVFIFWHLMAGNYDTVGLQGRYLIPLSPLLFISLRLILDDKFELKIKAKNLYVFFFCFIAYASIMAIISLLRRYYI